MNLGWPIVMQQRSTLQISATTTLEPNPVRRNIVSLKKNCFDINEYLTRCDGEDGRMQTGRANAIHAANARQWHHLISMSRSKEFNRNAIRAQFFLQLLESACHIERIDYRETTHGYCLISYNKTRDRRRHLRAGGDIIMHVGVDHRAARLWHKAFARLEPHAIVLFVVDIAAAVAFDRLEIEQRLCWHTLLRIH